MSRRDYRDAFRQMEMDMHRFTEDALRAFFDSPDGLHRFWQPAADVHETESAIVIKIELAGVGTDSVFVSLSGDGRRLSVSGNRTEPEAERSDRCGCHQLEIYFGPFERNFLVPDEYEVDRDRITATLRSGFLTIRLPRKPPTPPVTRMIPIDVVQEKS